MRHELFEDVLRDVPAKQLLDQPLLIVLDEISIGGAGKKHERDGRERLDGIEPHASFERENGDRRPRGRRQRRPTGGDGERKQRSHEAHENGDAGSGRDAPPRGCRGDKSVREQTVGNAGVELNPRHQPATHGRLEHVNQPGAGQPDEHDLVLEDGGVDERPLSREQLVLRHQQVSRFERRIWTRARRLNRGPIINEHRPLIVNVPSACRISNTNRYKRDAPISNPNGGSVQRHLVGTESASTQRSRNTKRRQVAAARTNERCDATRDAVFVESEKVVSESRGCVAQLREWRLYYRSFFNHGSQPVRTLPPWTRLRS